VGSFCSLVQTVLLSDDRLATSSQTDGPLYYWLKIISTNLHNMSSDTMHLGSRHTSNVCCHHHHRTVSVYQSCFSSDLL